MGIARLRPAAFPLLMLAVVAGAAAPESIPTTVLVVRHAEKAAVEGEDPPLSAAGRARARRLAAMLSSAPVGGLYASQFRRTRETLEPLAVAHGLEIRTLEARATVGELTEERLLRAHPGQVVVVASHSNLISDLAASLSGTVVDPVSEDDYEDLYLIQLWPGGGRSLLQLQYGSGADDPP